MSVVDATAISAIDPAGPVSRISTDPLPAADRLAWWGDMVDETVVSVSIRCPAGNGFRGVAEAVRFADTEVTTFSFSPMSAKRSPLQVRRRDPEAYYLVVVRSGVFRLEQQRRVACVPAGDMVLFSTSHPLSCEFFEVNGPVELTLLRLNRTMLPLAAAGHADKLLGEGISGGTGSAALLGGFLTGLPSAADGCSATELARLDAIGSDLAATVLAARLDRLRDVPAESRTTVLRTRVNAFIDHHVADPELRPATIAAAHHISVRTLHALFLDQPETVAAEIRRRRLERCRDDLADPALGHRTIGEIAARWGFRSLGDFSRAFRRAYDCAPSDIRPRRDREAQPAPRKAT
ncbi:helix-turn-helix domain-containing protein [Yinghuangia seranimata]|uniref:helix-turn-helix domain-containing protein n=1 Tax=Yinghuangia seranimata TaxID=408067 RepID=UPI00248BDFB5|nr:helix-turn-helix domain-containing protein [Yinghuangia seranimata]MDI2130040.1 helix-turn-helix domain-containing protein [Yinghuangia seranimata]